MKFSYFRLVSFLVGLFILTNMLWAQETDTPKKAGRDSSVYTNGLQFTFINSTAFAYKLHPQSGNYWRFGVSLNGKIGMEDFDKNNTDFLTNDTVYYAYKRNSTRNSVYISLNTDYLLPLLKNDILTVYSGGGFFVSYYSFTDNSDLVGTDQASHTKFTREISKKTVGVGLRAIGGVEGHVTNRISLFAEMNVYVSKSWSETLETATRENSINPRNERKEKIQGLVTGVSNIRIGLNVYF